MATIDRFITLMFEKQGTSLVVESDKPIMLALQGVPRPATKDPLPAPKDLALIKEIMPQGKTNDTDYAYEILDLARFRVNALRDRMGPAAVFRVIPTKIVTVEELGLSPEVQKLCYLTKGLVEVTGPTGSGKSTTLAAMIDLINRTRTDHIITIEDPIEFVHPNKKCVVTQRQVGSHTSPSSGRSGPRCGRTPTSS